MNIFKKTIDKLKYYLKRIYRLAFNFKKQEEFVWNDLKKLHLDKEWNSGFYEKEKCIETIFSISKEQPATFYYMIYDGYFHCRVKILESFSPDLTTDLFILAAHFNNFLVNGVVVINVNSQYIEYHLKRDLLVPLLYGSELYNILSRHYSTSKDIYTAFQRLVNEREAPAIIIADLLRENKDSGNKSE